MTWEKDFLTNYWQMTIKNASVCEKHKHYSENSQEI